MICSVNATADSGAIRGLNFEKLRTIVSEFVQGLDVCVMQFGHFMLLRTPQTGQIIPGIAAEMEKNGFSNELCKSIGMFPLLSWSLGLRLLERLPVKTAYALLLVNDWQQLKGVTEQRGNFYSRQKEIPLSFVSLCSELNFPIPPILFPPSREATGCYFSEVELRNRFKKNVENGQYLAAYDDVENAIAQTGVYCGRPNCTAEVAQLVADATHAGSDGEKVAFINIYPLSCRDFVRKGTCLAFKLFDLPNTVVLNIGLSPSVDDEEELLEFADIQMIDASCHLDAP